LDKTLTEAKRLIQAARDSVKFCVDNDEMVQVVYYYSGHGCIINGQDYAMFSNAARFTSIEDIKYNCLPLDDEGFK
jgi:hypothetical protein